MSIEKEMITDFVNDFLFFISFWMVGIADAPEKAKAIVPSPINIFLNEISSSGVVSCVSEDVVRQEILIRSVAKLVEDIAKKATGEKSTGEPKNVKGNRMKLMMMIQLQNEIST